MNAPLWYHYVFIWLVTFFAPYILYFVLILITDAPDTSLKFEENIRVDNCCILATLNCIFIALVSLL